LSKTPTVFNNIQDVAYDAWKLAPPNMETPGPAVGGYPLMGSHFFNTSPSGTGISPVWDFRAASAKGNPDAFVLAAKVASIPAPTGPMDVDWVQLKSVTGALATQVCTASPLRFWYRSDLICPATRFTAPIHEEELPQLQFVLFWTFAHSN
jgi:hypothetical protein